MPSSTALNRSALEEIERIRMLPKNSEGPIADTYERLQGIVFLKAAAASSESLPQDSRSFVCLQHCQELAAYNVADLVNSSSVCLSSRKDGAVERASYDLRWAFEIMKIIMRLQQFGQSIEKNVDEAITEKNMSSAFKEMRASLDGFDCVASKLVAVDASPFSSSIEFKYILNKYSTLSHLIKQIYYMSDCMYVREPHFVTSFLMNTKFLREAVHSLNTRSRSYLMQFRLFHQIPEVLSLNCTLLFNEALQAISHNKPLVVLKSLFLVNQSLEIIVGCVWPLIELMLPSEYYNIREHLGQTSGSHSKGLGAAVLRTKYLEFAGAYVESQRVGRLKMSPSTRSALDLEVDKLARLVSEWRTLHLMLPRHVLGDDVTSLIGSRGAYGAAYAMKENFTTKDPLSKTGVRQSTNSDQPPTSRIDQLLNALTGKITKRRFQDVELRKGFFSKKV